MWRASPDVPCRHSWRYVSLAAGREVRFDAKKTEILVIHFTLVMHADMSGHEPAWMPGVIRRENPGDSIDFAQRFAIKHGRPDAPD